MPWVFAYGSLAADAVEASRTVTVRCALHGYSRCWGVADTEGLAGMDLRPDRSRVTHGLAVPVSEQNLGALDARHPDHIRIDIGGRLNVALDGLTYAYIGSEAGRARMLAARRDGRLRIDPAADARVQDAFAALGLAREYAEGTDAEPVTPELAGRP